MSSSKLPESASETPIRESVSLYYAKAFDGEWYLLQALASRRCQDNLRTTGWAALCDHSVPKDGLEKSWKYAMFVGYFYPQPDHGWEGRYEGCWSEWRWN